MVPVQWMDDVREIREQQQGGVERAGDASRLSMQSSMERIVRRVARRQQASSAVEREILIRLNPEAEMNAAMLHQDDQCRIVAKQMSEQLLEEWMTEIDRETDTVVCSHATILSAV